MNNKWKTIVEFNNYQVNKQGNIKSLYTNKILKPSVEKSGYLAVTLYKNKIKKRIRVHRVVALTFIKNTYNKPCVNHKDTDKSNNKVSNLEWVTYKENMEHACKNNINAKKEKQGLSKLTINDVISIRKLYKTGNYSQRKLAEKFNVCQRTISMIVNNITWK